MALQPAFLSFVPVVVVDVFTFLIGVSAVAELTFSLIRGLSSEESLEAMWGLELIFYVWLLNAEQG